MVNKSNQTDRKKNTHTEIKARRCKKIIPTLFFSRRTPLAGRLGEYRNCHPHGGDGNKTEKSSTNRLSNNSNDVSTIK